MSSHRQRRVERDAYRAALRQVPGARRKRATSALALLVAVILFVIFFVSGWYLLLALAGLLNMLAMGIFWHLNDQAQRRL